MEKPSDTRRRLEGRIEAVRLHREGRPLDEILHALRAMGCSKIDSIFVLRQSLGVELPEAKKLVHFSSAWADVLERDERIWDEAEQALSDIAKTQ